MGFGLTWATFGHVDYYFTFFKKKNFDYSTFDLINFIKKLKLNFSLRNQN